jgi:large subunit ribosomal protein L24
MTAAVKVAKCHIKRDDIVIAISGEEAGGKQGKVLRVLAGEGRAIVEGFNLVKRHMRKTQDNPEGGILEKEAPMALSKLRKFDAERVKKAAPSP